MSKFIGKTRDLDLGNSEKFSRDDSKSEAKKSKKKRLQKRLRDEDKRYKESLKSTAATEILLPESSGYLEAEGMEKTFKFTQEEIVKEVDESTANKAIDLKLNDFGPYTLDYSRNGTHLLIGGKKGHVASMDWRKGELRTELHLNETVNAVKYLSSEQYFAVAQKKYTFIYDHDGTELHRMKQHVGVKNLEFLPYHYLLATSGDTGMLRYQDVSTGELVNEIKTKLGPSTSMSMNPWNAIIHLGSATGVVSLWAPGFNQSLVKIQATRGPIKSLSIDRSGHYMAVAGGDKSLKIYDVRTYKELFAYTTPTPASDIEFSDTGLLSVGWGPHVTVWKDSYKSYQTQPYMTHLIPSSKVEKIKHVPFEDLLGVGHSNGVKNLIIPGSGEANFDAFEANPYETAKQRQETEVRSLINKLPADSISLDPNFIGKVSKQANPERLSQAQKAELEKETERKRKEGTKGALRRYLNKKSQNVIDERKLRIEANLRREKEAKEKARRKENGEDDNEVLDSALSRFK